MRIIYFTSTQREKDYRSFMNIWKYPLNSSNQNFHHKLIHALAKNNKVDVISVRPFSRTHTRKLRLEKETIIENNITWHYLSRYGSRFIRPFTIIPQIKKILRNEDLSDAIFITDTINTSIVRSVYKIKNKYKRPIIGVCTDSPSNISGTKRSYTLYLLDKCKDFSGYIALTSGLNDLFNQNNKPAYILEGVVEDQVENTNAKEKRPYFFFGGAMMEKYGMYNLIEAFKQLNVPDVDLYLCGHHVDKEKLRTTIKGFSNIKNLGLLPVNKVLEYEKDAIACINPRPYSEDLDRFSIPSKTLEYMSMGRPVISVRNTILMDKFPNEVIWIDSANVTDIKNALRNVLAMDEKQRSLLGEEAKKRVKSLYSISSVSKSIQPFLDQFLR